MDGRRGLAPGAHREDHRRRAGDDVAARDRRPRGSWPRSRGRRRCSRVGRSSSPLVAWGTSGFGFVPSAITTRSASIVNSLPGTGIGRLRPGLVGLAELGADALQARDPAVLVAEEARRQRQPVEDRALLRRRGGSPPRGLPSPAPSAGRRCAPPRRRGGSRARTPSIAVSPAPITAAFLGRSTGVSYVGEGVRVHEVDAREELVGRVDALEVLARDRPGTSGSPPRCRRRRPSSPPRPSSWSIVIVLPMITSVWNSTPMRSQVLDVLVDDRLRQAVLGDAVAEHAADRVQRLEDRHRVAELREIARRRQARRARADDRDLLGPARDGLHGPVRRVRALPVRDEALEPADRDRLLLAQDHAVQLALVLDRADAAADRREEVPPPDRARGARRSRAARRSG